jgi:hypothetical protein
LRTWGRTHRLFAATFAVSSGGFAIAGCGGTTVRGVTDAAGSVLADASDDSSQDAGADQTPHFDPNCPVTLSTGCGGTVQLIGKGCSPFYCNQLPQACDAALTCDCIGFALCGDGCGPQSYSCTFADAGWMVQCLGC